MSETASHVLTGAGSGIGHEVARILIARGDRVILLVRPGHADEVARQLPGHYALVEADLGDPASLDGVDWLGRMAEEDRIDSLLHVAGVVDLFPVADLDLQAWQHHLDVNLTSPALITKTLLPRLRAARGTVVFVNSGAGLAAHPDWSAYAASKFGLRALADSLRAEEARHGVRVTSIYPGRTATPMQEKVHAQEGREYHASAWIQPATVARTIVSVIDLPRDAVMTEVTVRPA